MALTISKMGVPSDKKQLSLVSSNCSAFGLNGILKKRVKIVDADLKSQTFKLDKDISFHSCSTFNILMLKATGRRMTLTTVQDDDSVSVVWKSPRYWETLTRPVMIDFSKYKKAYPLGTSFRLYYMPDWDTDKAILELNFHSRKRFLTVEYMLDLKGSDLFCIMG